MRTVKGSSGPSDSDSEEKFKENLRLKAQQRKQRMAESKVDDQERKLVEFAQRLSARKNKVNTTFLLVKSSSRHQLDFKSRA